MMRRNIASSAIAHGFTGVGCITSIMMEVIKIIELMTMMIDRRLRIGRREVKGYD